MFAFNFNLRLYIERQLAAERARAGAAEFSLAVALSPITALEQQLSRERGRAGWVLRTITRPTEVSRIPSYWSKDAFLAILSSGGIRGVIWGVETPFIPLTMCSD